MSNYLTVTCVQESIKLEKYCQKMFWRLNHVIQCQMHLGFAGAIVVEPWTSRFSARRPSLKRILDFDLLTYLCGSAGRHSSLASDHSNTSHMPNFVAGLTWQFMYEFAKNLAVHNIARTDDFTNISHRFIGVLLFSIAWALSRIPILRDNQNTNTWRTFSALRVPIRTHSSLFTDLHREILGSNKLDILLYNKVFADIYDTNIQNNLS